LLIAQPALPLEKNEIIYGTTESNTPTNIHIKPERQTYSETARTPTSEIIEQQQDTYHGVTFAIENLERRWCTNVIAPGTTSNTVTDGDDKISGSECPRENAVSVKYDACFGVVSGAALLRKDVLIMASS
jgi:hypothetical protein